MFTAILTALGPVIAAIVPVAVKIIGKWIEKKEADAETRRKFYEFVESLETSMMTPARLRDSAARQRKRLDDMLAEIDAEEAKKEEKK